MNVKQKVPTVARMGGMLKLAAKEEGTKLRATFSRVLRPCYFGGRGSEKGDLAVRSSAQLPVIVLLDHQTFEKHLRTACDKLPRAEEHMEQVYLEHYILQDAIFPSLWFQIHPTRNGPGNGINSSQCGPADVRVWH